MSNLKNDQPTQYPSGAAALFSDHARADIEQDGDRGPAFCLSVLNTSFDGKTYEVIGIKVGDSGYYHTTYGRQTKEWVREMNERIGVNAFMQETFEVCSMFGIWSKAAEIAASIAERKIKEALSAKRNKGSYEPT